MTQENMLSGMNKDLQMIPLNQLVPSHVPARSADPKSQALRWSLKELGVLVPLLICTTPQTANGQPIFEIVDGNQRYADMLEIDKNALVPCRIIDKRLVAAMAPNVIGTKFNAMDIARGLNMLIETKEMNKKQAGQALGLSSAQVSQYLAMLKLSPEDQEKASKGEISLRQGRKSKNAKGRGKKGKRKYEIKVNGLGTVTFIVGKALQTMINVSCGQDLLNAAEALKIGVEADKAVAFLWPQAAKKA